MNNEKIIEQINAQAISGACLNFSDLMARIEADGGKSTAPQYAARKSPVRKIITAAASIVAVFALSAAVLITIGVASGGMAATESDMACDAVVEEEAIYDDYLCDTEASIEESAEAPESSEPADTETESAVSDSDVSDSDVSDSDSDEEE